MMKRLVESSGLIASTTRSDWNTAMFPISMPLMGSINEAVVVNPEALKHPFYITCRSRSVADSVGLKIPKGVWTDGPHTPTASGNQSQIVRHEHIVP